MLHNWTQGRVLHSTILASLNIENNFDHALFPKISVCDSANMPHVSAAGAYLIKKHEIRFSDLHLVKNFDSFTHLYFHELIHSTHKYTNRLNNWNALTNGCDDMYNLEERLADLGGMILATTFDSSFRYNKIETIAGMLEASPTKFALPWQDLEDAVLCYLKDDNYALVCSVLKQYKRRIRQHELTTIYEGRFDARF